MKQIIKRASSLLKRKQPAKLATDLRNVQDVQKVSLIDAIIKANDSFIKTLMGIYVPHDN